MGKIPSCDKDGPTKKGPWTPEEDQKLIDYIKQYGHGRWRTLPKNAGLKRCGKSCRLRWTNYLRPDIKRGRFSFEEEEIIIQLHSVLGNKWSTIAARLPGRTDNEIKNYWNTHIRRRLLKMGIDPITHTPRLDLLQLSSLLSSALSGNSSSSLINHIPNYILGDQNLLNLATTFLSYEPKSRNSDSTITPPPPLGFVPQENLVPLDHQHVSQNQFQSFLHNNQFQNYTTSTTTSNSTHVVPCANETQLMQHKLEQLSQSLMSSFSTNCPNSNSLANTWENNVQGDQALISQSENCILGNNGYCHDGYCHDSTHYSPFFNSSSEKLARVSCNNPNNIANMNFSSFLSTSSSSPYMNYSGSTTTTAHEDEKDSFCSNTFMYDVANFAL